MRLIPRDSVIALAGAVAFAIPLPTLAAAEGGYCTIPTLKRDRPALVEVESIDHDLCGAAIIDGRVVRLEETVARKVRGEAVCGTPLNCTRRVDYYVASQDSYPYTVIFSGPAVPRHN